MSNTPSATKQPETPRAFLDEAYQSLGYEQGALLNAVERPAPGTREEEEWLEKGDWLALAHKVGAEKLFFVNNDPVLVFFASWHDSHDENVLVETFRRVWCMARPLYLFIALAGELRVYRLDRTPARDAQSLRSNESVEPIRHVAEVAEKLQAYRREQLELGLLPGDRYFGDDQRADKRLIQDLKTIRKDLLDTGLEARYAHALIGRSIFIRYLEDRGVIDEKYYLDNVVKNNQPWREILLNEIDRPDLAPGNEQRRYYRILSNKDFTFALFRQLSADFNGDMFPNVDEEEKRDREDHLELIQRFLVGDADKWQRTLFLWAYDFEIIPIELISSIYEEFYHKENFYRLDTKKGIRQGKRQDDMKTHYTPSVLVEHVLSHLLPRERLATKPTILDPACGSGIFLVESFRRIVRYRVQKHEKLSPEELRQILKEQIRGIEINEEAVRIAAFSLYLALLHYQEPPTIRKKKLPHLIYKERQPEDDNHFHVLFKNNTFALVEAERELVKRTLEESSRYDGRKEDERLYHSPETLPVNLYTFDIITGNPPWGFEKGATEEIRKAQEQAKRWCGYFDWPIGDNEPGQEFIARSLSLLKIGGECGLLVSTGVFLKHHDNSKAFRQRWLEETTIKTVVNFAHVRHEFFNADAPFAFVHFVAYPAPSNHWVHYWSAKKTEMVDKTRVVVLALPDIRQVRQIDLACNDFLWKVYWWGNHRDAALIKALRLNETLEQLRQIRDWPKPGRGFEDPSPDPKANRPSMKWLRDYKALPSDSQYFYRYGTIDTSILGIVPDQVHRSGAENVQSGWRLLIGRGVDQAYGNNGKVIARLEHESFCFRSSIVGINVNTVQDWERKILIGILWSSLARYYYFMIASTWGPWHHEIHVEELMSLPISFPKEGKLREEIIGIVDTLMSLPIHVFMTDNALQTTALLEQRLDNAIFDLYKLSEAERDLVLDLCEMNLEFLYRHSDSNAIHPTEKYPVSTQGLISDVPGNRKLEHGLEGYLYAFLKTWNREIAPEGEFCWRVIRPPHVPMIAVAFTTQEVGDSVPSLDTTDEQEWASVLDRCSKALRQKVSHRIYIDNMMRVVTDTEIYIIKRDERRLWTRSMAREDAEATLVQLMHLQEILKEKV
ncbi:MAG: N-6 DNA methylase [Ktedonobacteraceae bacterium]